MHHAIRKALLRFLLLQTILVVFLCVCEICFTDSFALPDLLVTLSRLCGLGELAQVVIWMATVEKFCSAYWGPTSTRQSFDADSSNRMRNHFDDNWSTSQLVELNTNGSIMTTAGTDATGNIRGDQHI